LQFEFTLVFLCATQSDSSAHLTSLIATKSDASIEKRKLEGFPSLASSKGRPRDRDRKAASDWQRFIVALQAKSRHRDVPKYCEERAAARLTTGGVFCRLLVFVFIHLKAALRLNLLIAIDITRQEGRTS
jgi:hypothetical protein